MTQDLWLMLAHGLEGLKACDLGLMLARGLRPSAVFGLSRPEP
jgi:hypothetical protein